MSTRKHIDTELVEKCGIVGIFTPNYLFSLNLGLLAAGGVQHRGQQGAGLAIKTASTIKTYKDNGLLKEIFTEDVIRRYNKPCRWLMVHCRYGTNGTYLPENLQPCIVRASNGDLISIIHNGEFAGTKQLRKKLNKKFPAGTSDTYLFAQLLAQAEGANWDEKIKNALAQVTGAYSLIIGVNNTLYATRDPHGIRPLVLGRIPNGWLLASETHAFDKVGAHVIREVRKGEILRIDKKGLTTTYINESGKHHFCDFEWAYFSRPNSLHSTHERPNDYEKKHWLSVTAFRERCGQRLAKESPIPDATFVVGVPDSGINMAMSYANTLGAPYRQALVRDHFDPHGIQRLFMRDDQKEQIKKKVLGKLSLVPDRTIWNGAKVVIGDDSIVRGNVSKQITEAIFALGAKEVHWIIGYPAVIHRCHLGVSMRTREELIAAHNRANPVKIAKEIGATSVRYISHEGFIQSRLLKSKVIKPKNKKEIFLANGGCGGCITGIYPVDRNGDVYHPKTSQKTLAVLISNAGTGTNLQAVIDAIEAKKLNATISAVVSDSDDAYGLIRAKKHNLPTAIATDKDKLFDILKKFNPDYIVLAGWKQFITKEVVKAYPNKILNLHPGLVPETVAGIVKNPDGTNGLWNKGKLTDNAIRHFLENRATYAGSSIHFLTPEFDFGPVLGRCFEPIQNNDTVETLYKRLKSKENELYISVLQSLCL